MPLSKEEILKSFRDDSKYPNINEVVYSEKDVLEAMDEWAAVWKERTEVYEKALAAIRNYYPVGSYGYIRAGNTLEQFK